MQNKFIRRVVHVAREYGDIIGAGGLRDCVKGMAKALASLGIETHIFVPYPADLTHFSAREIYISQHQLQVKLGDVYEDVILYSYQDHRQSNLLYHLMRSKHIIFLSDGDQTIPREGVYTYTAEEAQKLGQPELTGCIYNDDLLLNILLIKTTLQSFYLLNILPDIVCCHNGETGFLPLLLQRSIELHRISWALIPTLMIIHSFSHGSRGNSFNIEISWDVSSAKFNREVINLLDVPRHLIQQCFHNRIYDPVLIGARYATAISTVSEYYAYEIQETLMDRTSNWLGHRLKKEGIYIHGITSGIDTWEYMPEDAERMGIVASYSPLRGDFSGKQRCKMSTLQAMGFQISTVEATPLISFVGRFVYEKNLSLLARVIDRLFLMDDHVCFIAHGSGQPKITQELQELELRFPGRIRVLPFFDKYLANQIHAASDFCVIPSITESCGTIDYIAQLFGNIPIAHAVGGLNKIIHGKTGFLYRGGEDELISIIRYALELYRNNVSAIRKIQIQAVQNILDNHTWRYIMEKRYIPFFETVIRRNIDA